MHSRKHRKKAAQRASQAEPPGPPPVAPPGAGAGPEVPDSTVGPAEPAQQPAADLSDSGTEPEEPEAQEVEEAEVADAAGQGQSDQADQAVPAQDLPVTRPDQGEVPAKAPPVARHLATVEDEAFWYAFSLAVAALSPPVHSAPAMVVAVVLGLRVLAMLWTVRDEQVKDDVASARFLVFSLAILAMAFKFSQGGILGLVWAMVGMFMFNSLHNVRVMAAVAKTGKTAAQKRETKDKGKETQ
ncbi:MAG: hypothetical protein HY815_05605 [Candidatus Riflebacteria bacterium]|nr:hypothetical protein [Candidatus Riflebacteria bacterium]